MLTSDFDYNLPKELIAQTPVEQRDNSRLMILDKNKKTAERRHFYDIVDYLRPDDLLVWNISKVFNARLRGLIGSEKKAVEIFLLRPLDEKGVWKALAKPAKKLSAGMKISFTEDFKCEVVLKEADGTLKVRFNEDESVVRFKANNYGEVPTPPYISSQFIVNNSQGVINRQSLKDKYQTIYAKHEGSVAAPTAGLHFTPELI